jgi:hypothetical protein
MPIMKKIRHITRNRKNRNFAIPAAADAIPVNPNKAAISAITRKINAHFNILNYLRIDSPQDCWLRVSKMSGFVPAKIKADKP